MTAEVAFAATSWFIHIGWIRKQDWTINLKSHPQVPTSSNEVPPPNQLPKAASQAGDQMFR